MLDGILTTPISGAGRHPNKKRREGSRGKGEAMKGRRGAGVEGDLELLQGGGLALLVTDREYHVPYHVRLVPLHPKHLPQSPRRPSHLSQPLISLMSHMRLP